MVWQLAEAKNKLSEVVTRALTEGPQTVTRRGDEVVVVSRKEYERLTGKRPGLKSFLLGGGPTLDGVEIKRDRSAMRKVDL